MGYVDSVTALCHWSKGPHFLLIHTWFKLGATFLPSVKWVLGSGCCGKLSERAEQPRCLWHDENTKWSIHFLPCKSPFKCSESSWIFFFKVALHQITPWISTIGPDSFQHDILEMQTRMRFCYLGFQENVSKYSSKFQSIFNNCCHAS